MARGDFKLFDQFGRDAGSALHDFSTHTLTMGVITSAATPQATQSDPKWGTYSANEITTNSAYSAGGANLSSVAWTVSSNVATLVNPWASRSSGR